MVSALVCFVSTFSSILSLLIKSGIFYYFTLLKFVVETLMLSINQVADVETSGNLHAVLAAPGSQFTNALVNSE